MRHRLILVLLVTRTSWLQPCVLPNGADAWLLHQHDRHFQAGANTGFDGPRIPACSRRRDPGVFGDRVVRARVLAEFVGSLKREPRNLKRRRKCRPNSITLGNSGSSTFL